MHRHDLCAVELSQLEQAVGQGRELVEFADGLLVEEALAHQPIKGHFQVVALALNPFF